MKATLETRAYRKVFPPEVLAELGGAHPLPGQRPDVRAGGLVQPPTLLGPRSDMDDIAAAIRKIRAAAPDLARA